MKEEDRKPTGGETWQDKMPKVPRYYSPTELLERRVTRLEIEINEIKEFINDVTVKRYESLISVPLK